MASDLPSAPVGIQETSFTFAERARKVPARSGAERCQFVVCIGLWPESPAHSGREDLSEDLRSPPSSDLLTVAGDAGNRLEADRLPSGRLRPLGPLLSTA